MPASSLSKLALHLSRLANWQAQQAAHQGTNTFKSGLSGSGNGAASSLSGVGAGPGAGSGGAKFHAGRGAQYSYTNSGGRAVVQAGSSGANDGSTHFDDEDEHHAALHLTSPSKAARDRLSRRESQLHDGYSSGVRRPQWERDISAGALSNQALQLKFKQAFASATHANEHISDDAQLTQINSQSAEIHRDLIDARNRKDRVAVHALVQAYRQLPASQKTTAGFNAALQAQFSVRESGESLREVRETHKDMLDTGCLPNSSTSAVLVKALCARDVEKTQDDAIPSVAAEAQASSEAWRIANACTAGLQDIAAYNALIARCAAKGDSERALATYKMVQDSPDVHANADTYTALLSSLSALPAAQLDDAQLLETRLATIKQCMQEAIAATTATHWVNNQDSELFQSYIDAVFQLQAPDEAIDLFQKLISNDEGLASPAAHVTGALVHGFVQAGDFTTALAWIERIEHLNHAQVLIAAPDFTDLKKVVAEAATQEQREQEQAEEPSKATDSDGPESTVADSVFEAQTQASDEHAYSQTASTESDAVTPTTPPSAIPSEPQVLSSAPAHGDLPLQVIDCDLGERVKSMLRTRKTQDGKASTANLEGAYRLLKSEISYGNYAPPEVFAQVLNGFGRERKLHRVHELRNDAHVAIRGLVGDPAWQASAFAEVEDNVISALAHGGDLEGAHAVRHALLASGSAPSANAYAALISSIRDSTDEAMLAEQLYEESRRFGVRPNIYLINTVISRLGRARRADKALQLYESLPRLGLKPTSITYGASLNCAVRVGDIQRAEAIFRAMEADPAFVARPPGYNSMIQFFTYTQPDRTKALEYWTKMQARGVKPSSHTYKLLLDVYGTIEPVQADSMNTLFNQLMKDRSVDVAGPHWASLIECYGNHVNDIPRCQEIFRSITLKTGSKADAVAYEALLQVYAKHGQVDLIDALIAEMIQCNVPRTAYIANQAIQGYAKYGGTEGLMKARAIFLAMSQPPAGMASVGNHPLPRHHGAGAGSGSAYFDRRSDMSAHRRGSSSARTHEEDIHHLLSQTSSHATDSTTLHLSLEQRLTMMHVAFELVHPEPSTYEKMIQLEMSHGQVQNAAIIVHRMEERAFPAALVIKARALLGNGMGVHPAM